ncbi:MAG: hypothetical protein Q7T82_07635 [Armatimonadota bacterium]|nr:hypothetical protein [Armatimonadota bacterium]
MRRRLRYLFPLLILLLIAACGFQVPASTQQPGSSFTLIYTTDMQGGVEPCG